MTKKIPIIILTVLLMITKISFADDVNTLEIGSTAPNFKLLGIDDKFYTLDNFKNAEILVVIFTANHCPTAQAYEDRIIQLVKDYKDKNVSIVCISSNNPEALRLDEMGYSDLGDTFEEMKIRAKDKGFDFPYLYDGDKQEAAKVYGAMATPHVFIFDKLRKLRFTGRIDDAENIKKATTHDTRNAINALIEGKKVSVEKTKAFGCSIKWASKKEGALKAVEQWNSEKVSVELIDINGVKELLKNNSEKLRLINFWATWCGPCVSEFPELIEINRMYRNRDFELITVSLDKPDKNDSVLKFLQKNYASNKNYHFNSEDTYSLLDNVDKEWPGSIPYTLLVKPDGEIIYKTIGIIDPLEVKKAIVAVIGRYYE